MAPEFGIVTYEGLELLVYVPWWESGVIHGMTTRALSFGGGVASNDFDTVSDALQLSYIAVPSQCHGSEVVDLRTEPQHQAVLERAGDLLKRMTGDAVAAPAEQLVAGRVVGYGVVTADCVPIIVRGDDGYVLIHAGWRGLANGVISAALRYLSWPREAVVFAAAGPERYEVGADVIRALGNHAVFRPLLPSADKYLLDTAATAISQLSSVTSGLKIFGAGLCTISDTRFHSHRRDADKAGRCMTFVVPPHRAR